MATHKRRVTSPSPTRRALRAERTRRRRITILAACLPLLALPLAAGIAAAAAPEPFDQAQAITRQTLTASASRSFTRDDGTWDAGGSVDADALTVRHASNPVVRALVNGRDEAAVPDDWNADHASGDTGANGYPYGQCTWWAYERRTQLGLPVGSRLGNGADWAASARALGYWVDSTPREGDVAVFARGQAGSDPTYGHVAVVEHVNADGSVEISEANVNGRVGPFTRTLDASTAAALEYIHY